MDVEGEKGGGSCAPAPQSLSEPGSSRTRREASGGLLNKTSCAPCGEAICSEDVGHTCGMLGETAECSQFQQEGLAGNGSDLGGIVEVVKTSIGDLQMASDEGCCDNDCLSDSLKNCSKQAPQGVDGVGATRDANYKLRQDGVMPNIEAGVTGSLHQDSVSSISGSIDLSLDRKAAVQAAEISGGPVTCLVAGIGMWNDGSCASVGQGFQSTDAGCMRDTVGMGTEGIPSQRDSLAGNGGVTSGVAEDLQTCYQVQHCGNEGLPDLIKHDIEQLSCNATCLKKNANRDLKRDGLISEVVAEDSLTLQEDLVPSVSGNRITFSSDGKAGQIGESFGCSSSMQSQPFTSQGYSMPTCDSAFLKEAPGDESRCSRREVNASEEDLQTGWVEAAHDDRDSSDPEKHHSEKLPCGTDGLALLAGANHALEKIGFLPNINAAGSCPVDDASVPSIYGIPIDTPLDRQAGQAGCTSEHSACSEKLVCDSLGGDMPLGDNGLRSEGFGDENQHSGLCADKELQQNSPINGTAEPPPGRNICIFSYNQPCTGEPCCSGRGSSALCHQDSVAGGSGDLDHLEQALNTSSSADDKAGSVDFVSNANDGESQSQKLFVFRRRNPKRAASLRNLSSDKPDQINKASGGTRKPKKVNIGKSLHQSTKSMLPNKITKGRSGVIRTPKSCTWGSLKELFDGFCPSNGPSTSNSHPTCLGKGGSDSISGQKSHRNIRKSRSSRSAKSKCSTLSDAGHATSEFNGQPTLSTVADTDASLEDSHREKSYSEKPILILDSTSKPAESTEGNHTVKLSCIQVDTPQLSSAKETSSAYIHGECAKLSTISEPSLTNANGTVLFHVGFSPDSVLEVASVTCEGNSSASHDVMLHERSADAIALNGVGHHPSVLSTSNFGKEQAPLMNLGQHAKTTLGNENIRKEEIITPYAVIDSDLGEGKAQALQNLSTPRKSSTVRKSGCKKKDGSKGKKINTKVSTKNSSREASKPRAITDDSISPDPSELLGTGPPEFGFCSESLTSGSRDFGIFEHDGKQTHCITDGDKGTAFDSMKSQRCKKKDAKAGKKGQVQDPHKKVKSKKKNISDGSPLDHRHFSLPSTELAASHMNEQSNLGPVKNSGTISTDLPDNVASKTDGASVPPQRAAWVCCDDCQKWRSIPTELADIIGPNSRWTCKDNGDKAFADCSIPQEKSNAEINAELELSDVSADEADNDGSNSKACKVPSWTHVRTNVFLHRNRRTQSIDESMVCNCKPPQDGRMGCRDGCLNRMLNIECVKRTCPCGEQCSNQKFQRRSYAKLSWFHSGKKGYGLQLQEDVTEGRFLIEYVGEVLDITSYESRQRYYASKGQKHFYFMALNGGEVIDACTKGNLGRFINHSCSPNCRTEKWMVNGEVCIGIFAMRNIKKGEELTFDYNYVRVSGAAPQKCFCGTAKCRGYIGGEISVVDTVTQDDTNAGHYEEMVVDKDSLKLLGENVSDSDDSHLNIAEPEFSIQGDDSHDCLAAKSELGLLEQTGGALSQCSEPENSLEAWSPQQQQDEDVIRTPVHVSRTIESSLPPFPVHDTQKTPNSIHVVPNVINGSAPSSDFRSNQVSGVNDRKGNKLKQHRNVKPPTSSPIDNDHILGVEGRLNNLLDRGGGISKRKDATNGYLKLLLVTAVEGDSAGGTSKSVRDLSLILDALLKTTSRSVLLDIINKNGFQMLHNILKQNRINFHRTPIIRKLLKVLEFLAQKGILTSEHINGGPRFAGVESFRDSMLSLMRHNNFQVQQIARSFRDKWILCNIARNEPTEYPCPSSFAQGIQGTNMAWNPARRKRKSRWDYQPAEHYKMVRRKVQKAFSGHGEFGVQSGLMRNQMHRNQGTNNYHDNVPGMWSSTDAGDDEVPPGFESQQECQPALLCDVAPGLCMERYQSSLSISYGVPVAAVQAIGTPDSEGGQCHQKWKVAPGVPFRPFPPLPPYPQGTPCPSTSSSQMFQHDGTTPVKHNSSGYCGRTVGRDGRVHRSWRNGPRTKWPYHHQGRRFSNNHHRFEHQ